MSFGDSRIAQLTYCQSDSVTFVDPSRLDAFRDCGECHGRKMAAFALVLRVVCVRFCRRVVWTSVEWIST
jgi:hypothetical protein